MQTAHNHMVLIVDDDEIVGKAVGHLVTHAGAAAVYVQSGTEALGGYRPNLDVTCDLALQFDALPRVPVVLLFNDVDDEFAPDCLLLFQRRTETFLDAECIAMLGRQLFVRFTGEGSGQHGH